MLQHRSGAHPRVKRTSRRCCLIAPKTNQSSPWPASQQPARRRTCSKGKWLLSDEASNVPEQQSCQRNDSLINRGSVATGRKSERALIKKEEQKEGKIIFVVVVFFCF